MNINEIGVTGIALQYLPPANKDNVFTDMCHSVNRVGCLIPSPFLVPGLMYFLGSRILGRSRVSGARVLE